VPGLVLAEHWPASRWTLLDGANRSASFLESAVLELGWVDRVAVRHERAELAGRDPDVRATFDLACARGFGPPAVIAECAAPLLLVGGYLIVSDPPSGGEGRWPAAGLAELGMRVLAHAEAGGHFTVLRQDAPCSERFPRLPGTPSKRPLF
jgi:16S rRNA (guanine527-N7)-methyltransferase